MKNTIPIPTTASWESTLNCNMRCSHCGLSAGKSQKNELNTNEAKQMLADLAGLGVKNMVISGGELTTRSDWQELTIHALKLFESVRLITNGLMGPKLISQLENMPGSEKLTLSLSLDGLETVHDQRRTKGSYKQVVSTLMQPSIIPKTVITTVGRDNFSELPGILKLCLESGVTLWSVQLSLPEGRMQRSNFLSDRLIQSLANIILKCQNEFGHKLDIVPDDCFGHLHPMRQRVPWTGCSAGKELIAILAGGSVTGCPTLLDHICGNIRQTSLTKIWTNKKMSALRQTIPNECQTCKSCPGGCKTVSKLLNQQICF